MTARDDFLQRLGGALMDRENPAALTEALDAYDAERRAEVLREAAAFIDNDDTCDCSGCDTCQPRKLANQLRQLADAATPTSKEQQR